MNWKDMHRPLEHMRFGGTLLAHLARVRYRDQPVWRLDSDRNHAFLERMQTLTCIPDHPLATLLRLGGWPFERLCQSLAEEGLEPTLHHLARDGVWVDADEVKGRKPLMRRGKEIRFSPTDLDYVRGPSVPLGTSGTSGPRTKNPLDIWGFELQASYKRTMLAALDALHLPLVLYYPAPSAAGIAQLLAFALAGKPPDAWFCHLPETQSSGMRWSVWLRVLTSLATVAGVRLPLPKLAEVERPEPLLAWLHRHAPRGAVVTTFAGSALRLQAYADRIQHPLPRLVLILGGEPITARKRSLLESRGHRVYPWYGAVDAGRIAIGCLKPETADDMHLLTDRFAAIEWQGRLLLTSLLPSVHKRYLNTDCGDLATLDRRRCGCPLGELGLEFHLSDVRSIQKLCLEGITLPVDLVHQLADELLPSRCGGAPGDYQLLEEEGEDGWTRLVVRVAPEVQVSADKVIDTVHEVLLEASAGAPALALRIKHAGVVTVRYQRPRFSGGGKLLARERMPHEADAPPGD
jgi:hypothetical protein